MRRIFIFLTIILVSCLAHAAEARKLALLVGVDDYDSIQSLRCCVNDMNTLKEALMKIDFEENNIQMLVTGGEYRNYPIKKKIEKKLSEILSSAKPDDMVFLAFSGHGAQIGKKVYFCPTDTDMDDLDGTCVSITKVMDDLAQCKARYKWVIIDACRNDPVSSRDIRGYQVIPAPPESTGIALFQSCGEGEKSYEERDGGNGYFTKNFAVALSGKGDLDGDGNLTMIEVCKWTTDHTKAEVMKAEKKVQRPFLSGSVTDFIIANNIKVILAKPHVEKAQKAEEEKDYELAVNEYKIALKLWPDNNSWRIKLQSLLVLIKKQSTINVPDDYPTIAEAYDHVKDDGVITIQPGKYEFSEPLSVNRNVTFKGVSERPEDVIIVSPTSHAFQITSGSPSFKNLAVVSGANKCNSFFITGGSPKLINCVVTSHKGSGISVSGEKTNPQVESCKIINCESSGAFIEQNCLGLFKNCDFYGNQLSGITVAFSANPTVVSCKVHGGDYLGVSVLENGLGKFNDCEIYGNAFSEIGVGSFGNPVFTGCKIHDGKDVGVLVIDRGLGVFKDCSIYGNAKKGIEVTKLGNPTISGCKIHDNNECGVGVLDNGLGSFNNCEIYENDVVGIIVAASGNPTFDKCKIHNENIAGVCISENGRGKFNNCEIYRNGVAGIEVFRFGNPTITECNIHDNKQNGVFIFNKGMGTFNNNTLKDNYKADQLNNWNIGFDAGKVSGSGNTPPMPAN